MTKPLGTTRVLRRLLTSGMTSRAERLLERIHAADLGPILSELAPDERGAVIDLLFKQQRAATALRELPPEMLPQIFESVGDRRLAEVLGRLEIDDLLELVDHVPEDRREAVLNLLPPERLEALDKAELYPSSSAGRVMTTAYVALDEKMTAQQAIDSIRSAGDASDSILYLYVVDELRHLRGMVPIRRLVAAAPDRPCADLMVRVPVRVAPEADQEAVAQLVARYDLLAIPVTDPDGTLLGVITVDDVIDVITVDDVIDVITEEATEDMYHLAGLSEADRVFTPAWLSIQKRLPWMVVNLCTAFLAAWVVGLFEHTLEQLVSLAIFLPVVAGMGGNGGIQTLTVITRGIALEEIEFSSGFRAVLKEVAVGLALGAATGLISAGIAAWWQGNPFFGAVLFVAMVVTMAVAGLLGAAVPLALKALRQDPALGAGVIVTTFTDAFGFLTFLGIATLMLDRLT